MVHPERPRTSVVVDMLVADKALAKMADRARPSHAQLRVRARMDDGMVARAQAVHRRSSGTANRTLGVQRRVRDLSVPTARVPRRRYRRRSQHQLKRLETKAAAHVVRQTSAAVAYPDDAHLAEEAALADAFHAQVSVRRSSSAGELCCAAGRLLKERDPTT